MANTVKKIGNGSFKECNILKAIAFSENLETIGDSALKIGYRLENGWWSLVLF